MVTTSTSTKLTHGDFVRIKNNMYCVHVSFMRKSGLPIVRLVPIAVKCSDKYPEITNFKFKKC